MGTLADLLKKSAGALELLYTTFVIIRPDRMIQKKKLDCRIP